MEAIHVNATDGSGGRKIFGGKKDLGEKILVGKKISLKLNAKDFWREERSWRKDFGGKKDLLEVEGERFLAGRKIFAREIILAGGEARPRGAKDRIHNDHGGQN